MRGGSSVTSTLYLRFIRSTVISTCRLPTPEIRSCFVSGSKWWWIVGSSSAIRASALEILSSSPRVLGWTANEMAASGNALRRFDHEGRRRRLPVGRACPRLLGLEVRADHLAAIGGRRELVNDEVEQRLGADALDRRGAEHRDDLAGGDAGAERLEHLRLFERSRLQILDRKSTRLNSSHSQISYAVFCLKKKKKNKK